MSEQKRYDWREGEEYLAKAMGMMYFESGNKRTPGFKVAFNLETEDGLHRVDWTGWLTDAAKSRTIEIVTNVLGWDGELETDAKGVFTRETALDFDRQVKVTVKHNDKGYPEIQWVNSLGGAKFAGAQEVQARSGMESLGLRAEFLSLKKSGPAKTQAPAAATQQKKNTNVPF